MIQFELKILTLIVAVLCLCEQIKCFCVVKNEDRKHITCSGIPLSEVNGLDMKEKYETITIEDSLDQTIPARALEFSNGFELIIRNISAIEKNAFANLDDIEKLSIVDSPNLTVLKRGTFNDLGIYYLNISHTNLESIDKRTFDSLCGVKDLDLSHNRLTNLQRGLFDKLYNLVSLHLQSNGIVELHSDMFTNLDGLTNLDLSYNKLTTIPNELFQIEDSELYNINMSYNNIKHISENTFHDLKKLQYLNLSHNQMETIGFNPFRTNIDLYSLDLTGNNLGKNVSMEDFQYLSRFRELFLDSNRSASSEESIDIDYWNEYESDKTTKSYLQSLDKEENASEQSDIDDSSTELLRTTESVTQANKEQGESDDDDVTFNTSVYSTDDDVVTTNNPIYPIKFITNSPLITTLTSIEEAAITSKIRPHNNEQISPIEEVAKPLANEQAPINTIDDLQSPLSSTESILEAITSKARPNLGERKPIPPYYLQPSTEEEVTASKQPLQFLTQIPPLNNLDSTEDAATTSKISENSDVQMPITPSDELQTPVENEGKPSKNNLSPISPAYDLLPPFISLDSIDADSITSKIRPNFEEQILSTPSYELQPPLEKVPIPPARDLLPPTTYLNPIEVDPVTSKIKPNFEGPIPNTPSLFLQPPVQRDVEPNINNQIRITSAVDLLPPVTSVDSIEEQPITSKIRPNVNEETSPLTILDSNEEEVITSIFTPNEQIPIIQHINSSFNILNDQFSSNFSNTATRIIEQIILNMGGNGTHNVEKNVTQISELDKGDDNTKKCTKGSFFRWDFANQIEYRICLMYHFIKFR